MKKLKINNLEEKLFYEKLDNGLEVFLVPLKNKKNYYISFNVKYGNSYMDFICDDKKIHVPSGVAHFLEHKLFERDDIRHPFEFYSSSGSDVNAATSINYTSYYCSGNNNFDDNLKYLLNWITKLDITDEKVEKEKGIIIQEARMHGDNPSRLIYDNLRNNLFVTDPYGKKVIGEEEDILSITKEDLTIAYNSFYRPDNMFIVVVGCFDEKNTIKIIKEELKNYNNPEYKVTPIKNDEDIKVNKEYQLLESNISIPKIGLGYKIDLSKFKIDKYQVEVYISMILKSIFGNTSIFYEEGLKNDLFIDFSYNVELTHDKVIITFFATTNKKDILVEKIKEELNNISIKESDIERTKKVWIANEIKILDRIPIIANDILYDIITYGEFKNDEISFLRKIKYKDVNEIIKKLDFENFTLIEVIPKK